MSSSSGWPPAAAELHSLVLGLAHVRDSYEAAHDAAISLTRITDWKAAAAEAFHERAEGWVQDLARVAALAEEARAAAAHARDFAAYAAEHQLLVG